MQFMQSQQTFMRNIEIQIGQLASALNWKPLGRLPSDRQVPLMEDAKESTAVELRSGKQLRQPYKATKFKTKEDNGVEQEVRKENNKGLVDVPILVPQPTPAKYMPRIPHPERLQKSKKNEKFQKFLDIFKKLSINIPFVEALVQMPNYPKFKKQIPSNKRHVKEYKIVALNEECNAVLVLVPQDQISLVKHFVIWVLTSI